MALLLVVGHTGCGRPSAPPAVAETESGPAKRLAAYGVVVLYDGKLMPAEGVIPYDLNTPLFSDYTAKYRYIKLPPGTAIEYRGEGVLEFPVGTIIAKTFTAPHDLRDPAAGERILETRILIRDAEGWKAWPYLWNAEQTEARLKLAGGTLDVEWVHFDGSQRTNNYLIPNANQCQGCHNVRGKKTEPVGPRADNLNRDFAFAHGTENQLAYLARVGALRGLPAADAWPRLPVWDHPETGSLDQRARAWLDVNCAHCHNPEGPARTSGLDLRVAQADPFAYGVMKTPVAAGRGAGNSKYDIVPGRPDESILLFRISSTHPGIVMPELGKRLVHDEGVALIREWIAAMPLESASEVRESPRRLTMR